MVSFTVVCTSILYLVVHRHNTRNRLWNTHKRKKVLTPIFGRTIEYMELEQFMAARVAIERPMLMEEEGEEEEAIALERFMEEANLEPQQIGTLEQIRRMQDNEQRLCYACNRRFSRDEFTDYQWGQGIERRCRTCERDGLGLFKRFDQNPVNNFIEKIFGKGEAERFKKWTTDSPWVHVILDGQEDYRKETNAFDHFLGKYPPFSKMCREVDHETRLYPLQKAILLDLQWDEVSMACATY